MLIVLAIIFWPKDEEEDQGGQTPVEIIPRDPQKSNIGLLIVIGLIPRLAICLLVLSGFVWAEDRAFGFVPFLMVQIVIALGVAVAWLYLNGTREIKQNRMGCLTFLGDRLEPGEYGESLVWLLIAGQGLVPVGLGFEWDEWNAEKGSVHIPPKKDGAKTFVLPLGKIGDSYFNAICQVTVPGRYIHESRLHYGNEADAEAAWVTVLNAWIRWKAQQLTADATHVSDVINKQNDLQAALKSELATSGRDLLKMIKLTGFFPEENVAIGSLRAEEEIEEAARGRKQSELQRAEMMETSASLAESTATIREQMGSHPAAGIAAAILAMMTRGLTIEGLKGLFGGKDKGGDQK